MLENILERIDKITSKKIEILAVTKNHSLEEIKPLMDQGIVLIGENRVQEAQEKFPYISNKIEKHFIGSLQGNKENRALVLFDVIQSVESMSQLQRLISKIEAQNYTKGLFLQCNTSLEDSKHGIRNEEDLYPMIELLLDHPQVVFQGLMTIGALSSDESIVRKSFNRLFCIKEKIVVQYPQLHFLKLSMGMSKDFEWAIQEGSDMIRLGQILFNTY
ncbi:MAG: YggS family pyridoxal phosphate-dependent enzyme [Brevinema sp.]